jgi:hypothetical protein
MLMNWTIPDRYSFDNQLGIQAVRRLRQQVTSGKSGCFLASAGLLHDVGALALDGDDQFVSPKYVHRLAH